MNRRHPIISRAWLSASKRTAEAKVQLPNGILYIPARDRLFVLQGATLRSLDDSFRLQLPRGGTQANDSYLTPSLPDSAVPVDSDAQGQYIYYADPFDRVLYKIQLSDGKKMAARRLFFSPSDLAVDSTIGIIYLVNWKGGNIYRIRLF